VLAGFEDGEASVARMERSGIREIEARNTRIPLRFILATARLRFKREFLPQPA